MCDDHVQGNKNRREENVTSHKNRLNMNLDQSCSNLRDEQKLSVDAESKLSSLKNNLRIIVRSGGFVKYTAL